MGALREPELLKLKVRTLQITGLYSRSATTSLSNICYNRIGKLSGNRGKETLNKKTISTD